MNLPTITKIISRYDPIRGGNRIYLRCGFWPDITGDGKVTLIGHSPPAGIQGSTFGVIYKFGKHHGYRHFACVNLVSWHLPATAGVSIPDYDQKGGDYINRWVLDAAMKWSGVSFAAWGSKHLYGLDKSLIKLNTCIRCLGFSGRREKPFHYRNWKVDEKKASCMLRANRCDYHIVS